MLRDFSRFEIGPPGASGVQVWGFSNDRPDVEARYYQWLSVEEITRAGRFRRSQDRVAYVVTRGGLRELLGQTLKCHPADVTFVITSTGKPQLADHGTNPSLSFNVSHTRGYSMVALSWIGAVGVDIEYIDSKTECSAMAERFFHEQERAYLRTVSAAALPQAFFRLWVRKEALSKALGLGLSLNLSIHDLTGAESQQKIINARADGNASSSRWRLRDVSAPAGYCAAIVHNDQSTP